jgi:hypothetical protein
MSIQMIALRNEFAGTMRRAEAKIGLLKEVIGRIQNGETVDVEGLLGTGNKRREREWEEGMLESGQELRVDMANPVTVLQEIEKEDKAFENMQKNKRPTRETTKAEETTPTNIETMVEDKTRSDKSQSKAPRGFY